MSDGNKKKKGTDFTLLPPLVFVRPATSCADCWPSF